MMFFYKFDYSYQLTLLLNNITNSLKSTIKFSKSVFPISAGDIEIVMQISLIQFYH